MLICVYLWLLNNGENMTLPHDSFPEHINDWPLDLGGAPRTIPEKWDLSEMAPAAQPDESKPVEPGNILIKEDTA